MKKLLIAVLVGLFLVVGGCAGKKQIAPYNTTHDISVRVLGSDGEECKTESKWTLSQISYLGHDIMYTQLFAGLSVSDMTRLQKDLLWLEENSKIRKVLVLVNSPGGDAFTGLAISELIRRYQARGFEINTHGSGIVASAAVPVFASGKNRTADSATIFMVHEAALWKWPGRETASDIASQNALMQLLRDKYMSCLVRSSNISEDDWLLMEAKTTWFSAQKALEIGLATEIE